MLRLLLTSFLSLFLFSASHAEVYKWVDENGITQFGDKPPSGENIDKNSSRVNLRSRHFYNHVKQLTPIRYSGKEKAPLIVFEELLLKLKGSETKEVEIGTKSTARGSTCGRQRRLMWGEGYVKITENEMMNAISLAFKDAGYRLTTSNVISISNSSSRLILSAEINRLRLEICNSVRGDSYQKANVYLYLKWKLKERLSRKVLFEGVSEGVIKAFDQFVNQGAEKALDEALAMAARNLLADHFFLERINSIDDMPIQAESFDVLKVSLSYGEANSTFKKLRNRIMSSAVTIKTPQGHGSGVVIDAEGYILTNAHVVGSNSDVDVIINNVELPGKIIRIEPQRDIALIQVKKMTNTKGVLISKAKPTEGDTLYVVGTPLNVALSNTVTKGIFSAHRSNGGMSFYQTDAAINPGNSGGPVFDEKGELVAISVAGVFTESGASLNVNLLIPIESALSALNLQKQRDVSHLFEVENSTTDKANNQDTERTPDF